MDISRAEDIMRRDLEGVKIEELLSYPNMRESRLHRVVSGDKLQCGVYERICTIPPEK